MNLSKVRSFASAIVVSCLWLFLLFNLVRGDEILYRAEIPEQSTNWSNTLSLPRFDPAFGQLTAIEIILDGTVRGTAQFENRGPNSAIVTATHLATLTLSLPNLGDIVLIPITFHTEEISSFDGAVDFDGESGRTMELDGQETTSMMVTAANDLAQFVKTDGEADIVSFPARAEGYTDVSGPGNFSSLMSANASGAVVTLRYIFAEPGITIEKRTNGSGQTPRDADDPDGADVPEIVTGALVTWTYEVRNTGAISFTRESVVVTDSVPGITPVLLESSDDSNDDYLSPGETWIYIAVGTAQDLDAPDIAVPVVNGCDPANSGQSRPTYENIGTVTVGDLSAADPSHYCNPLNPGIKIEKQTSGPGQEPQDADDPDGEDVPLILPGATVVWHYTVENTGQIAYALADVQVTDSEPGVTPIFVPSSDDNSDEILSPGETWTYQAFGVAQELTAPDADTTVVDGCDPESTGTKRPAYENIGRVQAGDNIDTDPSHYCNPLNPAIKIEKQTNGPGQSPQDADEPNDVDVPLIEPGAPVTWTYRVINIGMIAFTHNEIEVTDSHQGVTPIFVSSSDANGDAILSPGETWIYQASATAQDLAIPEPNVVVVDGCDPNNNGVKQPTYANIGRVEAGELVDTDPSHYCNPLRPGIELEKKTNGFDADDSNDPDVPQVKPGADVVWTYLVCNTGNVAFALADVIVSDSQPGIMPLFDPTSDVNGDEVLSPGETWTYRATAPAQTLRIPEPGITVVEGCDPTDIGKTRPTYQNTGTVTADSVSDSDDSHYCNPDPGIDIEKFTNGPGQSPQNADHANGPDMPEIEAGQTVTWTYLVTNTGEIAYAITEVTVADDQPGVTPILDRASDVDRDEILSPGEVWIYRASGVAQDLTAPTSTVTIVDGCAPGEDELPGFAYENIGSVAAGDATDFDPSHYCNPPRPSIVLEKLTNGFDADGANDPDVPVIDSAPAIPGLVVWSYIVTNTGNVPFALADIEVTDSQPGITPVFDANSDDGDEILSPGESWLYQASANSLNLSSSPPNVTIVNGCSHNGTTKHHPTYENIGTVKVQDLTDTDSSHYCNSEDPTAIDTDKEPDMKELQTIFLPIVRN